MVVVNTMSISTATHIILLISHLHINTVSINNSIYISPSINTP